MATLPALPFDVFPRVLGLLGQSPLPYSHAKALSTHYGTRGCVVVDMDQQTEPLAYSMPLLLNSIDIWTKIRLEIIQQILLHHTTYPLVFLNLRTGAEVQLLEKQSDNTSVYTVFVDRVEPCASGKYPLLDLTLIYPHVLDSLL